MLCTGCRHDGGGYLLRVDYNIVRCWFLVEFFCVVCIIAIDYSMCNIFNLNVFNYDVSYSLPGEFLGVLC